MSYIMIETELSLAFDPPAAELLIKAVVLPMWLPAAPTPLKEWFGIVLVLVLLYYMDLIVIPVLIVALEHHHICLWLGMWDFIYEYL
eukprot:CAMPEP_0202915382 /NCGR_PEP_ID=MMETSP1392-20130828/65549_1 /ASSEMBLY_ACC=CAM_ASM_000868 /TAXON_ID=225041 /ORGANISM="Chlamydomonas chlamydogama, Strain SAG 11-48b" /LENGTH=86 /DNA_ID=CAMNT_0049607389 /DNA_START=152 /DNA_END=413 /DNA_ORIENTATION=+